MKKILILLTIAVGFTACEKEETKPEETKNRVQYVLKNNADNAATYKYYSSVDGYLNDTGIVFTGRLLSGKSIEFTIKDFDRPSATGVYYLDWYTDDLLVSAPLTSERIQQIMEEYPTNSYPDDTVNQILGDYTENYKRKVLFGDMTAPVWYDMTSPNNKTYTLDRNDNFIYKETGKTDYKGKLRFYMDQNPNGNKYLQCVFETTGNSTKLVNGKDYSIPYGSSSMVRLLSGGVEGNTYKRR